VGRRVTELYEPHRDAWALGDALPSSLPFAGGAPRGGGGAAVVGGSLHCGTVLLAPRGGGRFAPGPSMACPRVHSAVAAAAGTVYVLVRQETLKKPYKRFLNILKEKLVLAGARLAVPAWGCQDLCNPRRPRAKVMRSGAAATRGAPGAQGGRAGVGTAAVELRSVEALPPGADAWRCVPELAVPRTALGAAALDGCLFAFGGQARRARTRRPTGDPASSGGRMSAGGQSRAKEKCAVRGGYIHAWLCVPDRALPRVAPPNGATLMLIVALMC
jgi:hypothetical protein